LVWFFPIKPSGQRDCQ